MLNQENISSVDNIVDDGKAWYAIRLYNNTLEEAQSFFSEKGFETFIPMTYDETKDTNGKIKRSLKPVIRNIIFIKQNAEPQSFKKAIAQCELKISVFTKPDMPQEYYCIPHDQMYEFRLMCNPELSTKQFISTEEAKMKAGTPVLVKFGPLKGLKGKLVRSNKKYFLLKEIPGISMMIKVSRWCCTPILK